MLVMGGLNMYLGIRVLEHISTHIKCSVDRREGILVMRIGQIPFLQ